MSVNLRTISAAVALAFVSAVAIAHVVAAAPPASRDTTAPTVLVTAPLAGKTVAGTITVTATATDNVGVAAVQFRLDGQNLGPEVTTAPFTITWDTAPTPNGVHVLTAVARDAAGNAGTSSAVAITVDNAPHVTRGVFGATGADDAVSSAILSNPLVVGVALRSSWSTMQPTASGFNWSYFDAEIPRAQAAGKQILWRAVSGGRNTPAWVMTPDVKRFSFLDDNLYSPTYNTMVEIPVFWDPVFLARKKDFIAAAGARYSAMPGLILVSASCANALTDDWNVPHTSTEIDRWVDAGYTSDLLIDACKQIIDATMLAFPRQLVLLAVGRNGRLDDPHDADYVAREVASYGRTMYPGRFFVQKNGLSAKTPDPATTTDLAAWQVLFDSRPDVGGQMLWYVTDDPTCRMNGQVTPCDSAIMLRQAVEVGARYGMQYQEVYKRDLLNPALADVVRYAADILSPPTAPVGLSATATSSSQIRLAWTAATDTVGVTGYRIARNGVQIATTTATAYQDIGLTPGTVYTYDVSALDAAGNESPRASVVATAKKK